MTGNSLARFLLAVFLAAIIGCGGDKEEKPVKRKGSVFDRMKQKKDLINPSKP
jgi:hypothetical protein